MRQTMLRLDVEVTRNTIFSVRSSIFQRASLSLSCVAVARRLATEPLTVWSLALGQSNVVGHAPHGGQSLALGQLNATGHAPHDGCTMAKRPPLPSCFLVCIFCCRVCPMLCFIIFFL